MNKNIWLDFDSVNQKDKITHLQQQQHERIIEVDM